MSSSSSKAVSLVGFIVMLCLVVAGGNNNNAVAAFDYGDALDKALLFFEAQRSGKLPPDQRVKWRGDSGLSDGSAAQVDLVGGYYDAGDNVKFGLPMAFTVTMLAWSVADFGKFMGAAELRHAQAAVRWGSDYLLKAAAASAPDAVYVQVGEPYRDRDHACWERPEDMDTPRSVYKVTPQTPGSDVAGETAAALAAASIVFRDCDPSYSSRLLRAAQKVFDFADRYRGSYSDSLSSVACPFYCPYSGYQDELLWAATWLHLASMQTQEVGQKNGTVNDAYLSYIMSNGHTLGAEQDDFTFSWDDKRAGTKVLLYKAFLQLRQQQQQQQQGNKSKSKTETTDGLLQLYKAHADTFACSLLVSGQSQYTPGGLLFKSGDSNMQGSSRSLLIEEMEGSLRAKTAPPHVLPKMSWPEVVGMPATPAVTKIMTDRPDVAVEVLPPGTRLLPGPNPKRVRVFINGLGAVAKVPRVG